MSWTDVDWSDLFRFTVSPLELIVRGSSIYLFLFAIFRLVLRRDIGSIGVADVLVVVIVADASQNAMSAEYRSVADGMVLISTLCAWNVLLDWLAFRFRVMEKILQPRPLVLVRDGKVQRHNMKREWVSDDELMAKLREHGVDDLTVVKRAHIETDGTITVVKNQSA